VGALTGWRHCPRCATELRRVEDGGEERVECPECGFVRFAASFPTASAFVLDDDGTHVLLARRADEPDRGKWDVPGGFLGEGEDAVEGLRRELREETSLELDVGDFVGTFTDTYGDGPGSVYVLNLVWEARISSGEPVPADDVAELRWFPLDALPEDVELAFRWLALSLRAWVSVTPAGTPKGRQRRPFS
jgi:8-oxo-dGTP diphosphatase